MIRIAVVVTARPSWTKLQTICEALKTRPDVELHIIACASALLERYGRVVDVIKAQGFEVSAECWSVYEGETLLTSAKETGALLTDLCGVLHRLRPAAVLLCADRHEVLAAAQAAAYLHLPLAHLQGGERTGSIDDKVRDGISQLADIHFPATERAAFRVYGLTGVMNRIYNFGCPSLDLAAKALNEPAVTCAELGGAGPAVDLSQPFALVLQHPDTRTAERSGAEMSATLQALTHFYIQKVVFWPGQDAGMAQMAKEIRVAQAEQGLHTVRNLPPSRFLRLLTQCSVLIGNSSAGIRECSFLGVPVVNVGLRQFGRERAANVVDVPVNIAERIAEAIQTQIEHGPYPKSTLYGCGNAGEKIAEAIVHETTRDHRQPVRLDMFPGSTRANVLNRSFRHAKDASKHSARRRAVSNDDDLVGG